MSFLGNSVLSRTRAAAKTDTLSRPNSRLERLAVLAAAGLALACEQDRLPTVPSLDTSDPSFDISDGSQPGGNPGFFFLPPLVPDPSEDPDFSPDLFDATAEPTVHICLLDGSVCAAAQPADFPIVFTMSSGPGSETVRVDADDESYIVNWHAVDFVLDPERLYRISVLVSGTQLGFADVDVVSSGRDLRNVTSGEHIGLIDGRTLPIRFRIEQDAVISIEVTQLIAVQDQTRLLPRVDIALTETIAVGDTPKFLPAVLVRVMENIAVSDQPLVLPPVSLTLAENVTVTDAARPLPPVEIEVIEQVAVLDQPGVLPPVGIEVMESILIDEAPSVSR